MPGAPVGAAALSRPAASRRPAALMPPTAPTRRAESASSAAPAPPVMPIRPAALARPTAPSRPAAPVPSAAPTRAAVLVPATAPSRLSASIPPATPVGPAVPTHHAIVCNSAPSGGKEPAASACFAYSMINRRPSSPSTGPNQRRLSASPSPTAGCDPESPLRETRCSTMREACALASRAASQATHEASSAVLAATRSRMRTGGELTRIPYSSVHTSSPSDLPMSPPSFCAGFACSPSVRGAARADTRAPHAAHPPAQPH